MPPAVGEGRGAGAWSEGRVRVRVSAPSRWQQGAAASRPIPTGSRRVRAVQAAQAAQAVQAVQAVPAVQAAAGPRKSPPEAAPCRAPPRREAAGAAGRRGRHLSCSPSAAGRGTQRGSRSAAAGGDLSLQTFSGPVNLSWSQMRGTKVSIKKYRASEVTKRQLVMTYKMHAIF